MSTERWERVKDLFVEVEARPPAERGSYLDAHCAADPDLRAEVERLLANDPSVALIDRSPVPHGLLRSASGAAGKIAVGMLLEGRFRIVRMLGSGGMGDVYQAEDTRLDQMVAIKTIRTEFAADENAVARFRREISLARQVTHPSICRVFDFFSIPVEVPAQPLDFLTMEFIDGETLAALLKREGPLSFESLPEVLEKSRAYTARPDLPDRLTIDFSAITQVDSSAVALLLEWRREAARLGKSLLFESRPPNLLALADLYGVTGLIQPCRA